ncbi:MAG: MATE family efflux transporter [Sedimentisphaerales bacterium]|nr:MATE family efflux transporter [Sedimentisphaerales bacterium]
MTSQPHATTLDSAPRETSLGYMLKLSAPMVVSTISLTIMQFVDRFMVSRLGTEALAAVLPAGFVAFLPGGFAMGVASSLNTFVSQSLGRGEKAQCSSYFWQMAYLGVLYSLGTLALLGPAAPLLFKLMGQPTEVVPMEVIYFRIMLYAQLVAVVGWSSNQFFMGIHRPTIIMCSSLCGQVVNVFANYTLIFGKFGFPSMGIAGAAWGTMIGMAVTGSINVAVMLSRPVNSEYRSRQTLGLDLGKMRDLLKVGLPAGVGLMVNVAFWGVVLFALVGRFGTEALAATSAVLAYTNLSALPVVGMSTALTAVVGKAIGAGRKELAVRQTRVCLTIALLYMGLVGVLFFLLRDSLMVFWSQDPEVIRIGSQVLICAALYQVFHAARITYGGALNGAGDTMWLALVSGIGAIGVLGVGGGLVVWLLPGFGTIGPWVMATVSIVVVGLANRWRFLSRRWMEIDLFKHRPMPVPLAPEPRAD